MRKPLLTLAFLLAGAGTGFAGGGGKLPFTHDPAQGLEQAQREGKPVFLYFTADW